MYEIFTLNLVTLHLFSKKSGKTSNLCPLYTALFQWGRCCKSYNPLSDKINDHEVWKLQLIFAAHG